MHTSAGQDAYVLCVFGLHTELRNVRDHASVDTLSADILSLATVTALSHPSGNPAHMPASAGKRGRIADNLALLLRRPWSVLVQQHSPGSKAWGC